jgi:hypothetical protein
MNEMKKSNYFSILCAVLLTSLMSGCAEYPAYETPEQLFVNKSSLNMYVGDETLITVSPADGKYTWSSDNESVVKVSQTGLVTATGEGIAVLSVKSENSETKIDVKSKTFIYLDSIVTVAQLTLPIGVSSRVWAYPRPEDASEVTFTWRSDNPEVATVDQDGYVTVLAEGTANIVVSAVLRDGSVVEKVITMEGSAGLVKYPRTTWTAESKGGNHNWIPDGDGGTGNGGLPVCLFDGNIESGWHSNTGSSLPQCVVVDMKKILNVSSIILSPPTRADWCYLKDLEIYFSNTAVTPDGSVQPSWGEAVFKGAYPGPNGTSWQIDLPYGLSAQYVVLLFTSTSINATYISVMEFEVYGLGEDEETMAFNGPHILSAANPCIIDARDFDFGGEGVSFHDDGSNNPGVSYRADNGDPNSGNADVESAGNIGYTNAGEWVQYTVEVHDAGLYEVDMYMSVNSANGGSFSMSVDDGAIVSANTTVPNNGDWGAYRWAFETYPDLKSTQPNFRLSMGRHKIRVNYNSDGFNWKNFKFTRIGD